MKNIFFFAFIVFVHLFSTMLSGAQVSFYPSSETIHYMDETRLDRFYIRQLLSFFNSAQNKEWDKCQQSLSSYAGPLNVVNGEGYTPLHLAVHNNQKGLVSIII